ncbi:MAG: tRNA 4-thiouridine(8) synthase ThiI [Spirochaetales bacterium]|nr:tRNA 4-thiouridine(8) synthase ThiI [Spirochaetales bacterium]MBP7263851.1 tRNA 4-thiouridine(8) synthase ThiI [Spirochaetia bacterium]
MDALYLIKLGEIGLKEGNRAAFQAALKHDIKRRLSGIKTVLEVRDGRYYLVVDPTHAPLVEYVLSRTPGVNGWARAERADKDMSAFAAIGVALMKAKAQNGAKTFKVEARRSDKGFPLDSYGIARELGAVVLESVPSLRVDVHRPDAVLHIEVREKAYLYTDGEPGPRGLPVGSGGTGLLLLSGGIDSPVAGWRMLKRGLALEALYFNAYPYTSREAWDKVRDLATVLARHSGGMVFHTAPFTDVQLAIKTGAPSDRSTLYLRACMMMAADMLAKRRSLNSLVTGESLGQVASQTAENMRFTESYTDMAVLRPLAGTDKEDTVLEAKALGSFDISILPYEDCCVLFSPKHPVLKARFDEEKAAFDALNLRPLVQAAVDAVETVALPFSFPA